jgi:mannose-1-phosphate guanylyltransferase / mannose-6-phosphate isomerase
VNRPLIPVVLSGGSGTRLWPLSRELQPKQFLPLLGATSLFQETLLRAQALGAGVEPPVVICNRAHGDWVAAQAESIGVRPQTIVLEPAGRNTAPAVGVAALLAARTAADPLLLVLPADHVIADTPTFVAAVRTAAGAAEAGQLVTFGVVPHKPETGYGYILCGEQQGPWFSLGRFVEKPDLATAESYVRSGRYLWNSGMFLFSAAAVLRELREHAPEVVAACERAVASGVGEGPVLRLGDEFLACPASSIDYAVMEKTRRGAVVPLDAGWSDVGSWPALHDVLPRDAAGNATVGDVLLESCTNSFVTASGRFVAAIGLNDVVVIETDDAVLVVHRDRAQEVKKVVEKLGAGRRTELLVGRKSRPT